MSAWISSGARPRPKTGQGKSTLRHKLISSELRAKLSNRNITVESSTPCAISTRSCTDRGFQLEFHSCQDTRLLLRIPWIVIYLRRPWVDLCDFPRAGGVLDICRSPRVDQSDGFYGCRQGSGPGVASQPANGAH